MAKETLKPIAAIELVLDGENGKETLFQTILTKKQAMAQSGEKADRLRHSEADEFASHPGNALILPCLTQSNKRVTEV